MGHNHHIVLGFCFWQIVIEDCVVVLHESIQNNVQYDYVINDLTEFPVDKAVKGKCISSRCTIRVSDCG